MRRVAITGIGILSPIGNTAAEVVESLRSGRSGVSAMPEWAAIPGLKTRVAAAVRGFDPKRIARSYRRTMGRMSVMAAFAAMDAVADSGLPREALASARAGAVFGSTTGSPEAQETFFADFRARGIEGQEGTLFMKVMSHSVAANVASVLGVRGRVLAPSAACASSTQAIGIAFEAVRDGVQDVAVCGGADELHPSSAGVFDVVYAASRGYNDRPQATPRPFDRDRDGLVAGEGAAALVLEPWETAVARGARVYGELLGYATACDAENMSLGAVDGMAGCMLMALDCARVRPSDLDYVNAHATGTIAGDAMEAEALRRVAPAVPVSSLKGHAGHTLAACGAIEAIASVLMMREGFIAPTLNLENVADDCRGLEHVLAPRPARARLVLSSNFAFGGISASIVLASPDEAGMRARSRRPAGNA